MTETFTPFRRRLLSRVREGTIRELVLAEGRAEGFVLQTIEWSRLEATPLVDTGEGEYAMDIEGMLLEVSLDASQLTYRISYPDGEEEMLTFTSMDGRGETLVAAIPRPRLFPDLSGAGLAAAEAAGISLPARTESRREIALPPDALALGIAPDGRSVIVITGTDEEALLNLVDGSVTPLPIEGRMVPDLLAWSPSGRFLTWVDRATMGTDRDVPVIDLARPAGRLLLDDGYDGSNWDLPEGIYSDERSLWVDDRRLLVARRDDTFGLSVWLLEVDDPEAWIDGEPSARKLITADLMERFEVYGFDHVTGRLLLRSGAPLSVSDAEHPFAVLSPGEARPGPLPPATGGDPLFVRSRVSQLLVSVRRIHSRVPQGPIMIVYRGGPGERYPSWRPGAGVPLIRWTGDHRLVFLADQEGPMVELQLAVRGR